MPYSKRAGRAVLLALGLSALASCTVLEEYVNPYLDGLDEQADAAGKAEDTHNELEQAEQSAYSGAEQTADSGSEMAQAQQLSLLQTAGPNPYLSQQASVGGAASNEFSRGIAALNAEDWPDAERIFATLSKTHPQLSGPWLNLGIAQFRQDRLEQAQSSFEAAIKANESNQEAYNQLALLHRKQGRFEVAEQTYQRAIGVWPAYPAIRLNLGILYELYLGELAKALQQYEIYQSLQNEPDRKVKGWIADLRRRLQVTSS